LLRGWLRLRNRLSHRVVKVALTEQGIVYVENEGKALDTGTEISKVRHCEWERLVLAYLTHLAGRVIHNLEHSSV
jgi:hypothetical protein